MSWSNYHGHCYYCDGKQAPEDYIEQAKLQGVKVLGFSSHAPVPFETEWTMPADKLDDYLKDISILKNKGFTDLTILSSLEVDFIPGLCGPKSKLTKDANLDYVVGSVHFVDAFSSGIRWSIDNNNTEFEAGVNEIFSGDIKNAVTRYFQLQNEMLENEPPEIIGHIDKIRMHNIVKPHFNELDNWYLSLVYDTLANARDNDVVVEINTKYFKRNNLLFPSSSHFEWMQKNGIRVTINSDAHRPDALTDGFCQVAEQLLKAGYNELWEWDGSGFSPKPFNASGILF